jgi:hypothetical protein
MIILVVQWCRSNLKEHMQNSVVNRLEDIISGKGVKAQDLEVRGRMTEEIRRVKCLISSMIRPPISKS